MLRSKKETDIIRVLRSCEKLAKQLDPLPEHNWRLETYLKDLEVMLADINNYPNKPPKDTLADYNRRHAFLKGLIQATHLETPTQKVVAVQHLPHGAATTGNNIDTKEIHQKTTAKYGEDLKAELFSNDEDTLRQRNISRPSDSKSNLTSSEDIDSLLKYHHSMQEKIAENMLLLTKNLKEQTQVASQIIKKDTEVIQSSNQMTEKNLSALKSEQAKLEEQSRKACKCWLWIIIGLVMAIFINMVLFMKIVKKPTVVA